jgi:Concanavalin A-like lectin/glucanases superfamily
MRSTSLKNLFLFAFLLLSGGSLFGQCTVPPCVNIDKQTMGSRLPMWGTDSGVANAYVLTTTASLGPTLRTGSSFMFAAANANTGASTLNTDTTGVIAIKKMAAGAFVDLAAGDIAAGQIHIFWYDGTRYQCVTCAVPTTSGSRIVPCTGTGDSYASTILGEGSLINYWRMNDTAGSTTITDSKDSNTGTITGAGVTFGNSGCLGDAAHFNGVDSIPVTRSIADDFSIEFWMKTSANPGCANQFYGAGEGLVDAEVSGVTNDFGVLLGNYACTGSTGNVVAGTGNPDTSIPSTGGVNDGNWHYVVFTRVKSTGSIKLYVDDVLNATAGAGTNSLTTPTTIWIGSDPCCFNGYMQHVALYGAALSPTQINAHWLIAGGEPNGGSVTEIDTGTGLTGGPINGSGTISLQTPVAVANGGTGGSSFTPHGVLVGEGSSAIAATGTGTSGQVLTSNGASSDPTFQTISSGSGTVTTTGSPASGNLAKFSGATSITNGDLSGDVTTSGSVATTLVNIPDGTTQAGKVVATNISSPATPASGKTNLYVDSTKKMLAAKNDAGQIGYTVIDNSGSTHNFVTSVVGGVISAAQPAFSDLSGSATCSQQPAHTGDTTSSAGSCATTTVKVNGVSYGTSPSTNTVPVVTGSNTVTYETVPVAAGGTGSTSPSLVAGTNISVTGSWPNQTVSATGAAAAPGIVLVEQHTASTSAELDFTTCISSTYDEYDIEVNQIIPATNGANITLQVSTNGGSSYDTGSNYSWAVFGFSNSGSAVSGNQGDTSIGLANIVYNGSNYSLSGTYKLFNPGGSIYKQMAGHYEAVNNGDVGAAQAEGHIIGGKYKSTTAVNAFRILASSGNLTSGTVRCYGVAK